MSRAVAVAVLVAVVVVASLAAVPVQADSEPASLQTPGGFDSTNFRVTVYENGSATWAIEHERPLENDSEVDQFESYANNFEDNETELYQNFVDDATLLTQFGSNQTGREMDAQNFQRSASVDPAQSQGTVRMAFLWTNFADVSGDSIVVSDVFEGGFYIGSGQSIVFERGPGLAFSTAQPIPDSQSAPDSLAQSQSVTWIGERSFNDSRPYVALGPRSVVQNGTGSPAGDTSGAGMWPLALGMLAVVLSVAAVVARRSGGLAVLFSTEPETATESASPPPTESSIADKELLDDSDRVIELLEENGGRMKQVDIVDQTEWSKSKVSMLLSDMEDDDEISKLRVGRENIISLAGEEPDAAGSPFDEE